MTQPFADALTWVPKSRAFGATLAQANDLARAQSHGTVSLEHLLLALLDDADATAILDVCKVNRARLGAAVQDLLGKIPQTEVAVPGADPALVQIVQYAAAAAQQSGRREVNGAIVLAALVGDGGSPAAKLLSAAGLTFQDTVRALQTGAAQRPQTGPAPQGAAPTPAPAGARPSQSQPASQPQPPPPAPAGPETPAVDHAAIVTEDALTTARRRVAEARSMSPPSGVVRPPQAEPAKPAGPAHEEPPAAAASAAPPSPPPVPKPAAASTNARTDNEISGEDASPGDDGEAERSQGPAVHAENREQGWLPPPLPAQPPRPARLPPPIPPLPGPKPIAALSHAPDDELPSILRSSASAPWADAVVPKAGPTPPTPQQPFKPEALIDEIPERMRVGEPATIEIKIPRSQVLSLGGASRSSPLGLTIDSDARKAIAVRLRAKAGGMTIEPLSPETLWVDRRADSLSDEHVRWRWLVTPKRRGTEPLMISVGCHTISGEGIPTETMLPDQIADVAVQGNWRRTLKQSGGWLAALCLGALLMKLADGVVSAGVVALARLAGG